MELTKEQEKIIETDYNIKINANAGSGKTTTLYHYVKSRPDFSRVLYIVYNKAMQLEAEKKFSDIYHCDIHVKTIHSLSYSKIIYKHKYEIKDLKLDEVCELLNIDNLVLGVHIISFLNTYLSSDKEFIKDTDYINILAEPEIINFYNENKDEIIKNVELLYNKMDVGEFPITQDFHLKKWQLSKPRLDYDYILLDEGQDTSDVMLDIFNNQKTIKIIVGDTHQQIYAWRNAINSLNKIDFKEFQLTTSFRFNSYIAELATKTIMWKKFLLNDNTVDNFVVYGKGNNTENNITGIIGRSNIGLLTRVFSDMKKGILDNNKVAFEGDFKNYSFYNLKNTIKDLSYMKNNMNEYVKSFELQKLTYDGIDDYAKETSNVGLSQAKELFEMYGSDFFKLLEEVSEKLHNNRKECNIVYTTVHKSKGMEYDSVELLNDFKSKAELNVILNDKNKSEHITKQLVNEEINLLYVAITRSKGIIDIPSKIYKDL